MLHSPIYLCTDLIVVNQFRELEDQEEPTMEQQLAFRQLTSLDDGLHKHQEWGRRRGKAGTAQATAELICHQPQLSCTSTLLPLVPLSSRAPPEAGAVWATYSSTRYTLGPEFLSVPRSCVCCLLWGSFQLHFICPE